MPRDYQADLWRNMKSTHNDLISLPVNKDDLELLISLIGEQNVDIGTGIKDINSTVDTLGNKLQYFLKVLSKFRNILTTEMINARKVNNKVECKYCKHPCKTIEQLQNILKIFTQHQRGNVYSVVKSLVITLAYRTIL